MKKLRQNSAKKNIMIDDDEFQFEFRLAELSDEIHLFTHTGLIVKLTPLLIAITYRHIDIVRFILEKMKIDKRMALSIITNSDEFKNCEEDNFNTKKDV